MRTTRANSLPTTLSNASVVVTVTHVTFVLVEGIYLTVSHILWDTIAIPTVAENIVQFIDQDVVSESRASLSSFFVERVSKSCRAIFRWMTVRDAILKKSPSR